MSKFVILHKKKDTLNRLCCILKVTKQTLQHLRKKVPLTNTIHYSTFIYNQLKKLNLCKSFSNRVIGHLMSILISIFISGYHGKTTDFSQNSSCPRTTIAHFLNSGKWDDTLLENTLKSSVVEIRIFNWMHSLWRRLCLWSYGIIHNTENRFSGALCFWINNFNYGGFCR